MAPETSLWTNYSEVSPFVQLFRSKGRVAILDVLCRRPAESFNAAQIAELAGIDTSTVSRHRDELEEIGIVEVRHNGDRNVFSINQESEAAESLVNLHNDLTMANRRVMSAFGGLTNIVLTKPNIDENNRKDRPSERKSMNETIVV